MYEKSRTEYKLHFPAKLCTLVEITLIRESTVL